jgi:hypothetical protein
MTAVRCDKCRKVIGYERIYSYGGAYGDAHDDSEFTPNEDFGGVCRFCGGEFCAGCGIPGNSASDFGCAECEKEEARLEQGWINYPPFYSAITKYRAGKITRERFIFDWETARKNCSTEGALQ